MAFATNLALSAAGLTRTTAPLRLATSVAGKIIGRTAGPLAEAGLGLAGGVARRHPFLIGGTLLAGTLGGGVIGYEGYRMTREAGRAAESEQMARMILTAQSGPYGAAGRMRGISVNHNNTAGLTLAAHYAKNRSKSFGVLGLKFL